MPSVPPPHYSMHPHAPPSYGAPYENPPSSSNAGSVFRPPADPYHYHHRPPPADYYYPPHQYYAPPPPYAYAPPPPVHPFEPPRNEHLRGGHREERWKPPSLDSQDEDPLALLANVSSSFEEKDGSKRKKKETELPPTSPLQRTTEPPKEQLKEQTTSPPRPKVTPTTHSTTPQGVYGPPKPITPQSYHRYQYPPHYGAGSFDSYDSRYYYEEPHYWRGAYPPHYSPYYPPPPPPTEVPYYYPKQQEKKVLRKKFSWKHYPELEDFLIQHRDEYLKHSRMNYTAEQKKYNNWLTTKLISLAEQHGYVFDSKDFNFVAIRDRVRCYYKSYVQTARKRGIMVPNSSNKKQKMDSESEEEEQEEEEEEQEEAADDTKVAV